ncbi:heavy-metal-associated domain-containing protein [Aestuariibaculum sediminum]|uniref:Heavy-metal-associated domain-containing protein n=1 Tax=Aestuariibaculum sediminum TaxID=2770637 RepID=A0A8J6Q9J5_9FLAO|nr:heavy metal-associated domain-containing protein [Aestuariibaculum sediminum]MBD0830991.1 heavy-metal-associated domain-containing protein [Aestuariibaculum sediminum]
MKNIIFVALIALFAFNCKQKTEAEIKTVEIASNSTNKVNPDATFAKAEFTVEGMTCMMGCAKTIENKLTKMDGVKSAKVDFDKKLAMVEYDVATVTPENLTTTVTNVSDSYSVSDMKTVDNFSSKKDCDPDCKKACCANKTEAEQTACGVDCKKACCAEKA